MATVIRIPQIINSKSFWSTCHSCSRRCSRTHCPRHWRTPPWPSSCPPGCSPLSPRCPAPSSLRCSLCSRCSCWQSRCPKLRTPSSSCWLPSDLPCSQLCPGIQSSKSQIQIRCLRLCSAHLCCTCCTCSLGFPPCSHRCSPIRSRSSFLCSLRFLSEHSSSTSLSTSLTFRRHCSQSDYSCKETALLRA